MNDTALTQEEKRILLHKEATTILDFCCGPIAKVADMPFLQTWTIGSKAESTTDHVYGVMLISLAIHQLCKERNITPFANIDGTRIALQALTGSVLSLNNLFQLDLSENSTATVTGVLHDLAQIVVKATLAPLAPPIAAGFSEAWINQLTNELNPISQLILVSEHVRCILISLNLILAGNMIGNTLCKDQLIELCKLHKRIDNDMSIIVEGLILTFCDVAHYSYEELSNDTNDNT